MLHKQQTKDKGEFLRAGVKRWIANSTRAQEK